MISFARIARIRLVSGKALVAILTVIATAMVVTLLPAATGDNIADHVLGQQDFLHGSPNTVDGVSLNAPNYLAVDRSGHHLYLSDSMNNRVLGWHDISSFVNGEPADLVLGQPDFFSNLRNLNGGPNTNPVNYNAPAGVAVDSNGNLYVTDSQNDRVLEYNAPYAACASFAVRRTRAQRGLRATWRFFRGRMQSGRIHRRSQRRHSVRTDGNRARRARQSLCRRYQQQSCS